MARLVVKIHGQILTELNLQPGQEYFAGRSPACAIILAQERGISRQHLKIYEQSNVWIAQLTAKYGGLIYDGQSVEQLELIDDMMFSVPPYEFHFSKLLHAPADKFTPEATPAATTIISETSQENFVSNLDATQVGITTLVAYVSIRNLVTHTKEVFKLEGHLWTAGRHPSCEIVINDSAISRKHFDISHTTEGYFITDLGGSNGTKLNGEKIKPHKAIQLVSGDVFSVRNIEITFEIHNANYPNQLQLIESEASAHEYFVNEPLAPASALTALPPEAGLDSQPAQSAVLRLNARSASRRFKPSPTHIAIAVLTLFFMYLLFFKSAPKIEEQNISSTSGSSTNTPAVHLENLSPEKKKEVVDIFNLAKTYYVQRKYLLCTSQIERLHSLLPFYENSKEIEALCKQARELEQIEADRRRKEESRSEAESFIRKTVDECRAQLKPDTTYDEINRCLQPAIELNPQDGLIIDLINLVRVQETTMQENKNKILEQKNRLHSGRLLFDSAMRHYRAGNLKLALKEFNNFINGRYDLGQENSHAARSIASISKTLDEKLNEQLSLCQAAYDKSDSKTTIQSCDAVLKESPNNEKAKQNKAAAISQLKREMKSIYEDGALEESMGNIELAKEKWQKIINSSLPEDDYYQKSKQKLKKYGIGM